MSDSLNYKVDALAYRIGTEAKALRTFINGNLADLSTLSTTAKTSVVASINEIVGSISALSTLTNGLIDDLQVSSTTKTWSVNKIKSEMSAAVTALVDGAPGLLNTLNEIAAALANDPNFATSMTTALANRVRVDTAAQGLNSTQQANARANIDVYGKAEIGDIDAADFVATFNASLI